MSGKEKDAKVQSFELAGVSEPSPVMNAIVESLVDPADATASNELGMATAKEHRSESVQSFEIKGPL